MFPIVQCSDLKQCFLCTLSSQQEKEDKSSGNEGEKYTVEVTLLFVSLTKQKVIFQLYCRTGFNCDNLIIANCLYF